MRRSLTIVAVVGAAAVGALAMSDLLASPEVPQRSPDLVVTTTTTTFAAVAPSAPAVVPSVPATTTTTTAAAGGEAGGDGTTTSSTADPEHDTGVPLDEGEIDGDFGG